MKNIFRFQLSLVIIVIVQILNTHGQVTTVGNNSATSANDYVGWDANETDPLVIATKAAYNIYFQTAATQRMTILGTAGATQGFVGIGTNAPQSPLHLHG
ncbi:MAG: hypothetical protein LH473_08100, partial [Chitinophagales bacterium]|nr:hypothetical protein [Chitinophagales bacterium]